MINKNDVVTVRIFISSPGDVAEERDRARQVIDGLRRRYAPRFLLKPVLWEELALQVDLSFQQGIDLVLSEDAGSTSPSSSSGHDSVRPSAPSSRRATAANTGAGQSEN